MSKKIPEPQIAPRFEAATVTKNDTDKLVAVQNPDGSVTVYATVGSPDRAIVISVDDAARFGRWLGMGGLLTSVRDMSDRLFDGLNEKEQALVKSRAAKKGGK